jgi:hypothetical protein
LPTAEDDFARQIEAGNPPIIPALAEWKRRERSSI